MLDFAFSVPPVWMASEPGVSWGLSSGFTESAVHSSASDHRRTVPASNYSAANDHPVRSNGATEQAPSGDSQASNWAGLHDVAQSFARMWDEIDYGVMLLSQDAQLLYANNVARQELGTRRGLALVGYALVAPLESQQCLLNKCLHDAAMGKRSLQEFGQAERLSISFLPLEGHRQYPESSPSAAKNQAEKKAPASQRVKPSWASAACARN